MAVYKRGKVYWYEFERDGRRIRASADTGNQRAAEKIEAAAKVAHALGRAGLGERPAVSTLKEFLPRVQAFLATLHADRPRTVRFYRQQVKYLLKHPKLGSWRLDEVTTERIAAYAAWRRQTVGVVATNHALRTLRRALRLAQEWREIDAAPRVRMLEGETRRDTVLPRTLEALYLARLRPEVQPLCALMLETGLRPSEAVLLRWAWVRLPDGERGSITLPAEVTKNHKPRLIPLTAEGRKILEGVPRPKDAPEVWGGISLLTVQRDHARACREAKVPGKLTLHGLRHTAATRMGEAGLDAFALQAILGHASVTTTQRYVHPQAAALEQAAARMDALRVPTKTPTARRSRNGAGTRKGPQIVEFKGANVLAAGQGLEPR